MTADVRKKLIFFVFLVFLFMGLLTYQSIKGEGRFIDFPLYPLRLLEQGTSFVVKGVKDAVSSYVLIVGKEEENRRLLEKISGFEQEKNRYTETFQENERLRKILQLKSERPDYIESAEVFARDPTNWFQMVGINKGAKDGIVRDMVAVTPVGPVGRIHRVFDSEANVILITDVNSSVAVRLQSSRVEGMLEGRGDNRCYLKYIPREIKIQIGEKLITSGLDGIFPAGLLIGSVSDIEYSGEDIFQQIEVIPAQDIHTLEEVAILQK